MQIWSARAEPPLPPHAPLARRQLLRAALHDDGHGAVRLPLSPAAPQASRLAATRDGAFVFASGSQLFSVPCSPALFRKRARSERDGEQQRAARDVVTSAYADDYLTASAFSRVGAHRLAIHSTHRAEIQSVSADGGTIASVDAFGRCIVTVDQQPPPPASAHKHNNTRCYVLAPPSLAGGDGGWCGVALRANDASAIVVSRQMYRDVTLFDADTAVRSFATIVAPQAATFCAAHAQLIGVAERKDLSLFDARVGENQGCVARSSVAHGKLLCMDASQDGSLIATAGMDRVLHMFDVRMMCVRQRWASCLKYEVAGALLSRSMHGMAYVCSVDNEVACGAWSEQMARHVKTQLAASSSSSCKSVMISGANTRSARRAFGFRADVRVVGLARRNVDDGEQVAALSESGALYVLRARAE